MVNKKVSTSLIYAMIVVCVIVFSPPWVQALDCVDDEDCINTNFCYVDPYCDLELFICKSTPRDCSDGLYCNGLESCYADQCQDADDPCLGLECDEDNDRCNCTVDSQCDDGLFCTGVETCVDEACQPGGGNPCAEPTPKCEEPSQCLPADVTVTVLDGAGVPYSQDISLDNPDDNVIQISMHIEDENDSLYCTGCNEVALRAPECTCIAFEHDTFCIVELTCWNLIDIGPPQVYEFEPVLAGDGPIINVHYDVYGKCDVLGGGGSGEKCIEDNDCIIPGEKCEICGGENPTMYGDLNPTVNLVYTHLGGTTGPLETLIGELAALEVSGDFGVRYLPDTDCDGDVDGLDALRFKLDWGRQDCVEVEPFCIVDFDCDGDVDGLDALQFKLDWGIQAQCTACLPPEVFHSNCAYSQ